MQEINREMNESTLKAVGEFLKPEQITRLKQISYQQRGAQAFTDPEVAKKLNLTDAQKTEIQTIRQESMQEMREHLPGRLRTTARRAMKKMAELRKETLAKVDAKLNDEQQKTWKELLGAPFEVKYEQPTDDGIRRPFVIERAGPVPSGPRRDPDRRIPDLVRVPGPRSRRGRSSTGIRIIRRSRSWPGCAACRYRSRAGGRRGRPATGAGRRPGAAGRPRARRGSAGRRRTARRRRGRPRCRR